MSDISENEWKKALTNILEDLEKSQYLKMLECLDGFPKRKKDIELEKMPQVLIEHYGLERSINAIKEVMQLIPRNDATVQDLLRPFVEKLANIQTKGKKRKLDSAEDGSADPQRSGTSDKERSSASWKKSIREVNSSGQILDWEGIMGKVVKKSQLCSYKTKEGRKKDFFYVGVADESGSLKLMVYGKGHHRVLEEGRSYLLRGLKKDEKGFKVFADSKVSQTTDVQVPEEFEKEAGKIIEFPVFSFEEAKSSRDGTELSVEGRVIRIDPVEQVNVEHQEEKTKKQKIQLADENGSITIWMWGKNTEESKRISVGDIVKVTNLKTQCYFGEVSLKSTASTKIIKVQTGGFQKKQIKVLAIKKASKKETQLEAEFEGNVHTIVTGSPMLAKTLNLKLDGFKNRLVEKLPFFLDAEIQGCRIKKMTAAKEMSFEW